MARGYVYIFTNVAMPNLVKIGQTRMSPEKRAEQISAQTGVPEDFQVAHQEELLSFEDAEREIHSRLKRFRCNKKKEFFAILLDDAKRVVSQVAREFREKEQTPLPRLVVRCGQKPHVEYPIKAGSNFIGRPGDKPVHIDLED